jgi:hypothetical protein
MSRMQQLLALRDDECRILRARTAIGCSALMSKGQQRWCS